MNRTLDVVEAFDVEEGFLLTGEGGIRQIFRGGGGAHGDLQVRVPGLKLGIGTFHLGFEGRRQRRVDDPLTNLGTDARQFDHVVHIEGIEGGIDTLVEAFVGQEFAIGIGGSRKAAGHGDTGIGQIGDHLTERGVLAANAINIVHAELIEIDDVFGCGLL